MSAPSEVPHVVQHVIQITYIVLYRSKCLLCTGFCNLCTLVRTLNIVGRCAREDRVQKDIEIEILFGQCTD
jgi:hypothetical protein